ncbi:MAG: hypothetical protein RL224_1055 [Actinomycetota bacterium]
MLRFALTEWQKGKVVINARFSNAQLNQVAYKHSPKCFVRLCDNPKVFALPLRNNGMIDLLQSRLESNSNPQESCTKVAVLTYVIALPCVDVKDKACIDECPVDCIYEGDRMLYIHPDECVDCGACEPVCPVEAIYYEDDLPGEWSEYYKANVDFFSEIGSPGGAAKVGAIAGDHPLISALPPQGE